VNKTRVSPATMLYPLPAVMVTVGNIEESNIITIAWTGIINSKPPMTYISVKKSRYSHGILLKNMEFVINLTSENLIKSMDFCGVKSGKEIDKFHETKLTKEDADKVRAPLIKESPINIECKVFEVKELPSHDMFLAEIVAVHVNEELIDKSGKYWLEKADLIAFNHGGYYRVNNKPLGRFGYSIMKKKTKKKLNKRNPK